MKLDTLDQLYAWLDHKDPDRGSIVAAIIAGFVRFPESGQFKLLALVNDGMRLYVGQGAEAPILDDPRKLSDRLVGPASITVEANLWYPLKLEYFQK